MNTKPSQKEKTYQRFDLLFRVQHIILLTAVLLLIISGVPLKFPEQAWAHVLIWLQGGMTGRALIHHAAGLTLVGLGVFHVFYYFVWQRIAFWKRPMMLRIGDGRDLVLHLGYIVGLRKALPPMGRYTWFEKLDYVGLTWGFLVMGITGLAMLFFNTAVKLVPMAILQIMWAAHSEEAMLATLFLLIIHMYHVHFNPEKFPMTLTWLHGRIARGEMEKYHPLELAEIETAERAAAAQSEPPPKADAS